MFHGAEDVGCAAAGGDTDECVWSVVRAEACGGEISGSLVAGVFGFFAGLAERGVATGDESLHKCGRDGEGRWALAGVEDSEAAAGSGADVEEAATLLEACGDGVDGACDVRELFRDCERDRLRLPH